MVPGIENPSAYFNRPGAGGVRAVLSLLVLSVFAAACFPQAAPEEPHRRVGPVVPALQPGEASGSEVRETERLLDQGRTSLAAGQLSAAEAAADSVIQLYPQAPGSAEALDIRARALSMQGEHRGAADAARRYAELLGSTHPYYPEAVLRQSQSLAEGNQGRDALDALFQLGPGTPPEIVDQARDLLRELLGLLNTTAELRNAVEGTSPNHPLFGVIATELSVDLYQRGELPEAESWARRALEQELDSRENELARAVVDRTLEEALGIPMALGAILPRSEVSPGLLEYGEWIHEGIQVAMEEFQEELSRPVELQVVDDRGAPLGGRTAIPRLVGQGALGAVGPLTQDVLREAAAAREGDFPLISPFSFLSPEEADHVYSLSGPDPAGARALALYARELGLDQVVVVRPSTESSGVDARAFQEAFRELGGLVPREIVYDSGATFFQPQFQEVASLLPDGLFLPLSPGDIELLAPQVTFYGLDTLGIQLLGTAGWARDEVVLEVDSRHTDGVIAATTRTTQDDTEAFLAFQAAYEEHFQRTLRSEVPAFGYDAAGLLLTAFKAGPRTSRELGEALESIRGFPGATGKLTIEGGRIMRDPYLVRIHDHELIYISSRHP